MVLEKARKISRLLNIADGKDLALEENQELIKELASKELELLLNNCDKEVINGMDVCVQKTREMSESVTAVEQAVCTLVENVLQKTGQYTAPEHQEKQEIKKPPVNNKNTEVVKAQEQASEFGFDKNYFEED